MESNLLLIFCKDPIIGKVKTRIGRVLGSLVARDLYLEMLQYTKETAENVGAVKIVYTESGRRSFHWGNFKVRKQRGEDLGEKMKNAIADNVDRGFHKVCLIGSDCFEITAKLIEKAFEQLNDFDVVIGPTVDGGYYLVAMKKFVPEIFEGIRWSTPEVMKDTLKILLKSELRVFTLPMLRDCDVVQDIPEKYRKMSWATYE